MSCEPILPTEGNRIDLNNFSYICVCNRAVAQIRDCHAAAWKEHHLRVNHWSYEEPKKSYFIFGLQNQPTTSHCSDLYTVHCIFCTANEILNSLLLVAQLHKEHLPYAPMRINSYHHANTKIKISLTSINEKWSCLWSQLTFFQWKSN